MRDRLEAELGDRYVIERAVGQGGMATVWLARDRRDDRLVAIKVLHSDLAGAIAVDRFVREVRLTARLQHPSIVPVLDSGVLLAGNARPLPWYAMAYVAGESLRARLTREMHLPIDEALRIAREVAGALHAAHEQGVVHRDIKPENIILADGRVFVVDFGIAKALLDTGDERLTSTGFALGTPAYMSPEQAAAGSVDARTDQYTLAAVLYEMLAGEPPATGPNAQAIVARRLAEPARPIRSVRSAVPESVESAVLKALERVPADRFPDIATFAAALERARSSIVPRPSDRGRLIRRLLGVAVVLAVMAGMAWTLLGRNGKAASMTRDPVLLELYHRGVRLSDRRTPAATVDAIAAFNAAIARDSTYARAWVGLSRSYARAFERRFIFPGIGADSALQVAVAAADRALALDSTDAEAWVARAAVSRIVDPTDVRPTLRAARKATALDSASGPGWHLLGLSLVDSGDMDAGLDAWRQGVRRSPSYTTGFAFLALGHYWRGQYDSAAVWADSAVAVDPNSLLARTTVGQIAIERGDFARGGAAFDAGRRLSSGVEVANTLAGRALADARAGRVSEARLALRLADSLARPYSPTPLHTAVPIAHAYAALGDLERAMEWLARYPTPRDLHFQLHLRCDPAFAPIASDRRYRSLLDSPARPGAC